MSPLRSGCLAGVFSVGIWVWPERMSSELEAVVSLATSNEKSSLTVGWVNGGFYYTDDLKVSEKATPLRGLNCTVCSVDTTLLNHFSNVTQFSERVRISTWRNPFIRFHVSFLYSRLFHTLQEERSVLSERSVERMSWHYVVLTLEPVDRDVYFDTDATKPVHR